MGQTLEEKLRLPKGDGDAGTWLLARHPAWSSFIRFCERLQHGEIERLKIQDGLPVLAEVVKRKTKFT